MIDAARFWKHVALLDDSPDSCWIWVGATRDDGRGRYFTSEGEVRAHWAGWEIIHGEPVPPGSRLRQVCHHPQCVRHWELAGTFRKLTPQDVLAIAQSLLGPRALARKYGVSDGCIRWHRARTVLIAQRRLTGGRAYA